MDQNNLFKHFKNLKCLSCNSQFCFKAFSSKGSKNPLLLKCGHSLCYSCVKANLKTSKTITCPKCQISSAGYSKSIPEEFSFNLYVIGALTVFQFEKSENDRKLEMLTTGDGNFNYSVIGKQYDFDADNKDAICEECSTVAHWSCENCLSFYCHPCWSKVHGAAKSLMKHIKIPASSVNTAKNFYRKCHSHEMQDLDLFCKTCRKAVCSYCVIQKHHSEEHCLITVKEQNFEMVNQLKVVAEEAEITYKRMKHTLQKIKFTQSTSELPESRLFPNLKNQILQNFARLHGILQLQEEKLLKELFDKANERENSLRDLSMQLETQIQKTEFLLKKYETFIKKPQVCDWSILYDELSEVKTLPCYLISTKYDHDDPKVSFDENLIESLEKICTVELPSYEIFELRSGTDLPEDFAVEPLPVSDCDQRISAQIISLSNSDVDTTSNCSSRDLCECSETSKSNFPQKQSKFCEGRKYSVLITYINSPSDFYVTLNSQRKIKESIERRVDSFNYHFIKPSTICKDDLYLVKYKVDGKWYRGRVIEALPEDKTVQTRVVVHYIDYGNIDTVLLSWIRPLPPDLIEEPPLAIKCKLFNCVPKNDKWSKDSVKAMEKIVNGLTATLFVMKIHPDCLEVDLSVVYPEGQIGRDIVSVRDALIFLEYASFVGGSKINENPPAAKYEEQCLPQIGECFGVIITHVNSPDDFYLHRTNQDGLFLCKLGIELQNYYNENLRKGIIYNPVIGMPCAAKFSVDKKWYRAIIDDLPGKKMITVYYVDYGNKETLPWTDIRKLRENFGKRPPLALKCSLAKIKSNIPDNWNSEAIAYLGKYVLTKDISVQVEGIHQSEPKLKVLVFEQLSDKNICINNLFVEMCFATPLSPEGGYTLKSFTRDSQRAWNQDYEEMKMENFYKNTKHEKTRKFKLSAKELRNNYELEKLRCYENSSTKNDKGGEEIDCFKDYTFKVKVNVLSVESPSLIYVTFPKGSESLKNLQTALNNFYENTEPLEDKEWLVDSKCALYYSDIKNWCRASVSKIMEDGTVKVFLKDFAITVTAPSSSLRELDPVFTKYGPHAIKCHLADVAPPGDTWPCISCEYLESELEGYSTIYITKKGQIEDNSLPIELWVQRIIPASALEPTNTEWITLNKLLVEKGLAVPKRNLWCLPLSTKENVPSSEKETELNCETEEVINTPTTFLPSLSAQWLPPEPLKKLRFTGIPTYVDLNGHIYIQDLEDQQKLLTIRNSLREEYGNSKPSAEDCFWSPEQMCIARYFVDNEWYRGMVITTSEVGNHQVLFVDYGNVETCQIADLRKRVKETEIPILVHKFKLYGVAPLSETETWPTLLIEVLHSLVVDKKCEVSVLKPSHDIRKPHVALINLVDVDKDVSALLIQENLARALSNGSESSKTIDDLDSSDEQEEATNHITEILNPKVNYVPLSIPEDCTKLQVLVKALRNENEFYGHVVEDEFLPLDLKSALKQFQQLEKTLAEECHLQPKLAYISKGAACCCVHSGINKWCRGQIKTVGENCVCVFYVDYGYKEFLSTELVHECKSEWQKLPKMALKFYIPNIEKSPNVSKAAFMKALTSCLMETKFHVELLGRHGDCLEVELITEKGDALAYSQMLDIHLSETS